MAGAWLTELDRPQRRLLALALACSVALHLALLYLAPLYFASQRMPAPAKALTAHLEASKPAPPPTMEGPPPEPVPVKRHKPAQKPAAGAPAAPRASAPELRPQAPAADTAPVAASSPTAASTPAGTEGRPASAPTTPAAGTPDPGSLAQYRLVLLEIARRHKKYPRVAIDNNWEGRADLRMMIDASGALASLSVRKSAGYAALDEEALQMFRTAKSQTPVPPALRGRAFSLDVSAEFSLVRE